ncbi:hypothetical protein A9G11_12695 [Gilliamella sp. wkB108]|uniref:CYTH domain-containing protein n=1 Tax=Gilliamella sp. wkB108 TaxID=3120256 RepID=UPI00080EB0B6|nr:CYTH domain-containing protein [Gilliamella apicola]OCG27596.1 hypothetical protein A9G11_12695 [Gilliamella apicola]
MSSEIELKFEINQNDIGSLQLFLNQWASSDEAEFMPHSASKRMSSYLKLANTYYDTADYYLRHNGCGLRIRSSCLNNHAEQFEITLKRDSKSLAGLHERAEFNVPLPSSALDLSVLPCKALPENCDIEQLQQDLTPLFTTDFKRQTWLISFASSEIEVALDMGEIIANHQSKPIQEVELELKQGNQNDLLNFAIELSRFHLHLFSQSKASRGYRLLQDLPLIMCRLDPAIEPSLPELLKFWQQNEEYALQTDDLTFYQQMLNQVNRGLTGKNLSIEPELYQWQKALLSISSVAEFAYSEVNTKLKLMLIALVTN